MEEKYFTATGMVLPPPWKWCNFTSITMVVPRLYLHMIWWGPIKGQKLAHSYGLFQIHAIRVKSILTRNQIDTFTERNLFGTCASTVFKPVSPVPGEYFRLTLECRKTLFCTNAWLFDWVVLVYSDETRLFCFNKEKIWLSSNPFQSKIILSRFTCHFTVTISVTRHLLK